MQSADWVRKNFLPIRTAVKQRGDHLALLQLRRSSILCAESTRRGFSLDCRVRLLERRQCTWVAEDRGSSRRTEGLFL